MKAQTVLPCSFVARCSQVPSFARAVPVVARALQLAAAAPKTDSLAAAAASLPLTPAIG